jgi:ABC-type proline/glycine betaine transport system permease subunit
MNSKVFDSLVKSVMIFGVGAVSGIFAVSITIIPKNEYLSTIAAGLFLLGILLIPIALLLNKRENNG